MKINSAIFVDVRVTEWPLWNVIYGLFLTIPSKNPGWWCWNILSWWLKILSNGSLVPKNCLNKSSAGTKCALKSVCCCSKDLDSGRWWRRLEVNLARRWRLPVLLWSGDDGSNTSSSSKLGSNLNKDNFLQLSRNNKNSKYSRSSSKGKITLT